ncbi:hypothetical protein OBBRIDRAFT_825131 [Obba rivulosa]|uniref:Uncharacterized protein n=1 Tax=Obba rivulosa TaxID=1052685 RepID=A0A8E2DKQ0_9APHY|nr:hypothetical protein OBBRIDRAFT_825131 [Obba rivulosa]
MNISSTYRSQLCLIADEIQASLQRPTSALALQQAVPPQITDLPTPPGTTISGISCSTSTGTGIPKLRLILPRGSPPPPPPPIERMRRRRAVRAQSVANRRAGSG